MARNFKATVAEREKLKFSGMFMGATGSGKTIGALMTAKGLVKGENPDLDDASDEFWKLIGVVDTEHNRAKVYANTTIGDTYIGRFLHVSFEAPYDVDSYIEAALYLKALGCKVIIIDSLTHAWDDAGGILELHEKMGGQFATWQKINPIIKRLYSVLTSDDGVHIISTVRSKIKYEAAQSETGKMKVTKIGLKPIMRDDFEYEVLTALHFDEDHKITVIKDNTHIFVEDVLVTPDYGTQLHDYLEKGVDVASQRAQVIASLVGTISDIINTHSKKKEVVAFMTTVESQAQRKYGLKDWRELPQASLENVLTKLQEAIANV